MPTLSKDVIAEIEYEMADLIEQLKEALAENAALKEELQREQNRALQD